MFTITGSKTGMTTRVFAETVDARERLIELLGGEQGCARRGMKAETIRKR